MKSTDNLAQPGTAEKQETWVQAVLNQVDSLHFGVVQIVVHDARVVQIEKIRFDQRESETRQPERSGA